MSTNWHIGAACHPGNKRAENQDRVTVYRPGWFARLRKRPPLLLLADGMGGYMGGSEASQIVTTALLKQFHSFHGDQYDQFFQQGVQAAHQNMKVRAGKNPKLQSMGSTLVAAVLERDCVWIVNVGDSRAYHICDGGIQQLSTDQSIVADLVRQGQLQPEELLSHPKRNQLSMSISARREEVKPVYRTEPIQPDDALLLCSDGLWATVPEKEMLYFVENFPPQQAADDLVRLACEYGGPDNISVIIARQKITRN